MWLVAKWRVLNTKSNDWDVYYCAVPETWIRIEDSRTILLWPKYPSGLKDRKEGNPIIGKAEENECQILESGFETFLAAQECEKKYFEKDQHKAELTTDFDTDTENEHVQVLYETEYENLVNYEEYLEENPENNIEKVNEPQSRIVSPISFRSEVSQTAEIILTSSGLSTCQTDSIPEIMNIVKKIQKTQENHDQNIQKIFELCIETLEYVKRIQQDSGTKSLVMSEEKAKEILTNSGLKIPLSKEDDMNKFEQLLHQNSTFYEAMKCVLYQKTGMKRSLRKDFGDIWNELFDIVFLAKTYTMYGHDTKKNFHQTFMNGHQLLTDVLKLRHENTTVTEIISEEQHFFKHSNQSAKRKVSKLQENKKNENSADLRSE